MEKSDNNQPSISERDKDSTKKNSGLKNSKKISYGQISQKKKNESYKKTIDRTRSNLSINSRLFSKIIHAKFIEKIGDFLGATLARPNAILAGAAFSFFTTLAFYMYAKITGFELSGFETIIAFIIGWIIGIIYDYLSLFSFKK